MAEDAECLCLFIGGAKDPRKVSAREKQFFMYESVKQDFFTMFTFADKYCRRSNTDGGESYEDDYDMVVQKMLINSDLETQFKKDIQGKFDSGKAKSLLELAKISGYSTENDVRTAVQTFLKDSAKFEAVNLILFMTGHGEQARNPGEVTQESFVLPMPGKAQSSHYTDTHLTEDLAYLPEDKHLYIVCHSCHSGGMINFWEVKPDGKWVVVFASAEADILAEWDPENTAKGFVESFCDCADETKTLGDIATEILDKMASVEDRIRPAFIPIRPEYAATTFLG